MRRDALMERLVDDIKLPAGETIPQLHNMIKYVNNEALGADLHALVFEKSEQKSNRICRERSKLDREILTHSAKITRLKRNIKVVDIEKSVITARNSALTIREKDILSKMTGKISSYNSLK